MTASEEKSLDGLDAEQKEKVQEILQKDAATGRAPTGAWRWLVALLGFGMVVFYFYTAGLASVATQYHRGVYVLVTYVLVFLLYPSGSAWYRYLLALLVGALVAATASALLFYPDVATFHAALMAFGDTWSESGAGAAIASMGPALWLLALGSPIIGGAMMMVDRWLEQRYPQNPVLTDVVFALARAALVYYWIHEFEALNYRAGAENELDALISIAGILISLEVCRRVLGWSMTLIGILLICYGLFGPYFPDIIAHRGFGVERLATALYLTTNGVFGVMANVLATYVILFIFFGAFLHKCGAGRFFIDLPMAAAGHSTGGPAKVAVVASALFGSVSGSAIANTVSTGAFTIPLMKRAGFRPHVAGAIEPSASIGGMFMPPIMGAGGFLMAELTETPYAHIMLIAIFPALLYFFSVFAMIHFEAKKHDIRGIDDPDMPHWKEVLRKEWYYSMPLIIITVLMIIGKSPGMAAFWSALSCIVVSWVRRDRKETATDSLIYVPISVLFVLIIAMDFVEFPVDEIFGFKVQFIVTALATLWCLAVSAFRKNIAMDLRGIWEAIQTGARNTLIIGATVGVIGVIVGTISLTGIGLKFSDIIISVSGDNLLAAVLLIALASLVLGMGVPVTAAYLIVAVLAVPPLMELGVVLIAAHMIVYWFSQDSNITPPVCVAAYAGAAVAGSDPWKTGWTAFKFAKLLYVVPLLFAYTPQILFEGKPLVAPEINDPIMGAMILEFQAEPGDTVEIGDPVMKVMDGEEIREITASRAGVIKEFTVAGGSYLESGAVIAETSAKPTSVLSSMFSAVLGTLAFSALTMAYFIRKTNLIEWLILAVATVLLYWPTLITDGAGLVLVAIVYMSQKARNRRDEQVQAPAVG